LQETNLTANRQPISREKQQALYASVAHLYESVVQGYQYEEGQNYPFEREIDPNFLIQQTSRSSQLVKNSSFTYCNINNPVPPFSMQNNQGSSSNPNGNGAPFNINNYRGPPFHVQTNQGQVCGVGQNHQNNAHQQVQIQQQNTAHPHGNPRLWVNERIARLTSDPDPNPNPNPEVSDPSTNEELRLNMTLANTLRTHALACPAPIPPRSGQPITPATPAAGSHILVLDELAIGRLQKSRIGFAAQGVRMGEQAFKAHRAELEARGCHFCVFKSDWGVRDNGVLLERENAHGFCSDDDPNGGEFMAVWNELMDAHAFEGSEREQKEQKEKMDRVKHLDNLLLLGAENAAGGATQKTFSKIDGADITRFMRPMFCQDCPWTQADVKKARICSDCRREKLMIIAHGCHKKFLPIGIIDAADFRPAEVPFDERYRDLETFDGLLDPTWLDRNEGDKRCMLCANLAGSVCASCPLKLCDSCEVVLVHEGKGWLDNLFYYYEHAHLRNDAFLLRSDGGGF
jgi:predicted Zn-ribbon and HTH transcriptional regulator